MIFYSVFSRVIDTYIFLTIYYFLESFLLHFFSRIYYKFWIDFQSSSFRSDVNNVWFFFSINNEFLFC